MPKSSASSQPIALCTVCTQRPAREQSSYCSRQCRERAKWARRVVRRPQVVVLGIDSETATDPDGTCRLTLIACSDGTQIDGHDIRSEQALSWIVGHKGQLWTFYGDYDVNFWVRDFGVKALDRLRRTGWCVWRDYKVHHIPRRQFEVWERSTRRYACIYDAFPFVNRSFVAWLRDWQLASDHHIQQIERMKAVRSDFARVDPARVLAYTRLEVEYIAEGVSRIKDRVAAAAFTPARWLGPGAVAAAALRHHRVRDFYPKREHPWADRAYYGGRIETSVVGMVRESLYAYDLNSAYPWAAASLPCLRHGKWRRRLPTGEQTALVHVRWSPRRRRNGDRPPSLVWGPFPCRPVPGAPLRYYQRGEGTYWWDEILPWMGPTSPYSVQIVSAWVWEPRCTHQPFAFVPGLYAKRQELKQQRDPAEYAIKLVLNSLYGKLAQSVGSHPYRCIEYAGLITARCRARLAPALMCYGKDVLVVATDGILTRFPEPDMRDSSELGAWARAGSYSWADVWQPGFYVLSDGKARTRGFTARDVDVNALRQAWRATGPLTGLLAGSAVSITKHRLMGYRLATAQGNPELHCRWIDDTSELSYWPLPRRDPYPFTWNANDGQDFIPTQAPRSWAAERDKAGARELGKQWEREREIHELADDGEPQGYVRD